MNSSQETLTHQEAADRLGVHNNVVMSWLLLGKLASLNRSDVEALRLTLYEGQPATPHQIKRRAAKKQPS